jgi:prepilin-type N-terminal cleavage/methylation domain-containing protein
MHSSYLPTPAKQAFSLVELSIVLVILGLLIGGILSGQALIRAAELRAVSAEYSRYQTALYSFRDKYFALAGDMPNATRFWGVQTGSSADGRDAACAALTHTTPSTTTATCNGDGNGRIDGASNAYERYRLWQHLANAGLIEGSYTGVQGSAGIYNNVPGQNTPKSKTDGGTWSHIWTGAITGNASIYDGSYGNTAELRNSSAADYSIVTPQDAWNTDIKMDDGLPGQGNVRPYNTGIQANCTTSNNPATATYNLSYASKACSFLFMIGL